jgi:hypothetical protein
MLPSSPESKIEPSKQNAISKQLSLTLKMEPIHFSEESINFYQSTRYHISDNATLQLICFLYGKVEWSMGKGAVAYFRTLQQSLDSRKRVQNSKRMFPKWK